MFKYNLQFFADGEETTQEEQTQGQEEQTQQLDLNEIFSKLDGILERRLDGVAKSILKDSGIAEDELKDVIAQYKTQKNTKVQETTNRLTELERENEELKASIINAKVQTIANAKALELGVDKNAVAYVTKLADFANVTNDKGEVNEEVIVAAITKVLEDIPALKMQANNTGFVQIGGSQSNTNAEQEQEKALRRAFGLK